MSFVSHHLTPPINDLRLNRADKLNALTMAMYRDLAAGLKAGEENNGVHVHRLTGQGDAFCAGNDIADFQTGLERGLQEVILPFLTTLAHLKKPLIVGVNGPAVGIGTTLLLHADFVVASQQAYFQTPFVKLGLVPEAGSSLLAPQLMGHRKAFELLVMGETFSPEDALQTGLINKITSPIDLQAKLDKATTTIAALPPNATQESKALMAPSQSAIDAQMAREAEVFQTCLQSNEAQTAFASFFAKTKD